MTDGLLSGRVFVEIADPVTEYGGLLLAGLGADVYLVEPPGGAATRARRPLLPTGDASRRSVPFLARNLGKRSIVVDPESPGDRRLLGDLVARADGLITFAGARLHPLVVDAAVPRVTITDPRGVGAAAIVAFAAGGGMSSSGWPHQPPTNAPSFLALDAAGIYAAVMLLVALRAGPGPEGPLAYEVRVDEAAVSGSTPWTRPLMSYERSAAGQGIVSARLGAGPYPVIACRDGFVRVLTGTPGQWAAWKSLLGSPEVLDTPEWDDPVYRAANFEALIALASDLVRDRPMTELFLEGQRLGLTITPMMNLEQFMADPHVTHRGVFTTVEDPTAGAVRVVRPPVVVDETPFPGWSPAPALDADRSGATTQATGRGVDARAVRPTASVAAAQRPLAGLRVLDCGVGAVVPEAASLLALLGAEVIKIESRRNLDFLRRIGLGGVGDFNNSPTFNQLNLGVLSFAVDMATADGRALLRALVPRCDIILENMRGGVMRNWGLTYEEARALRPDLIYLSSQGLGDGPYGGFRTYGPNLQAFSGVAWSWAHPDDPYPVGSTLNHPDHVAGKQALVAVLAALMRRDRTGAGAFLDCAQFEGAASLIGDRFLAHQVAADEAGPAGNRSLDMAPHGAYPCAGDDAWCAIAVPDDGAWSRLAATLGEEWCADLALRSAGERLARVREIDARLSAWTAVRSAAEVEQTLRTAGVPVSRVRTGPDLVADDESHASGFFPCVAHPTAGARHYTGLPITAGGERLPSRRPPLLGEHDEYVLFDILGLDAREVSRLVAAGAVGH